MHQVDFAERSKKGKEEVEGMKSFSIFHNVRNGPKQNLIFGQSWKGLRC